MKKWAIFSLMMVVGLSAAACGKKAPAAETTAAATTQAEVTAAEGESASAAKNQTEAASEEAQLADYSLYKDMEGIIFGFTSGVGAWETMLEIQPDGSFTGEFYDANMGESGDGYDGTIYEAKFSGQLSEPEKKTDEMYAAEVLELAYDMSAFKDGDSYIDEDGTLHVASFSYGIDKGDHLTIYTPEISWSDTDPNFGDWVYWQLGAEDIDTLGEYGIYNEDQKTGFFPDKYAMGTANTEAETEFEESELYKSAANAYENQSIPDELMLPDVPVVCNYVSDAYSSVTIENLQGGWINTYKEGSSTIQEILLVNGETARIESYRDGEKLYGWNGEGYFSIEDRSERNVCPAVRINSLEDGSNICTIYVRWVKDNSFYDGGFLKEWKRMDAAKFDYLYDTVNLENLQGVWYSEYYDAGGYYRVILNVDGETATLLETVDGFVSNFWNNKGAASIELTEFMPGKNYPELLIKDEEKNNGTAGIYITNVTDDYFFDAGFCRYWYKVPEDVEPYWGIDYDFCDGFEASSYYDGDTYVVNGNNLMKITPIGSSTANGENNKWKIEVTNYQGAKLELEQEVEPESGYFPDETDLVFEEDVNFDGVEDIVITQSVYGVRCVRYSRCFLNQGDKFVEVEGFENLPDAFPDPVTQTISCSLRTSAATYTQYEYVVEGTKVRLLEKTDYEYDDNKKEYVKAS